MPKFSPVVSVEEFKDPFAYTWEVLPLAANGTSTVRVTILADSDFVWVKGIASMYQDVAARTHVEFQDVTVTINDSGSGRNLEDRALPLRHWFGHPRDPIIIQPPKIFVANSTVTITFTNGANVAVRIHATMLGYKWYKIPR